MTSKEIFLTFTSEAEYWERKDEVPDLDMADTEIREHWRKIGEKMDSGYHDGIIYEQWKRK